MQLNILKFDKKIKPFQGLQRFFVYSTVKLPRARALDNQVYVAACSPSRDTKGPYVAFGNSLVANPWGEVCGKTDAGESLVYASLDSTYVDAIREQLPLLKARRPEIY